MKPRSAKLVLDDPRIGVTVEHKETGEQGKVERVLRFSKRDEVLDVRLTAATCVGDSSKRFVFTETEKRRNP